MVSPVSSGVTVTRASTLALTFISIDVDVSVNVDSSICISSSISNGIGDDNEVKCPRQRLNDITPFKVFLR